MKSAALRHPARLAGASLLRMQSDARLAELAVAGHEAAFDAIVDRYRTPLTRYCAGITGPSRAEDAVQQALINAHEAMTRTDEVRHLKPWLYRIAHNAALNVLRAVKDDVPLDDASASATAAASPAESFERSEQFRTTLAALQALPERQRAALVLRELEGRSHEEIAAALGVTKGSARQHLMRGRAAMRSAVTAITPYPLVARLAELLSAGGGNGAGWVDAATGAGASATLMKLGAGVAATGALVGGAVGTRHVVREGHDDAAARPQTTRERSAENVVKRASAAAAVAATPAALPRTTPVAAKRVERASPPRATPAPKAHPVHHRGATAPKADAHAITPSPAQSVTVKHPSKGKKAKPISVSPGQAKIKTKTKTKGKTKAKGKAKGHDKDKAGAPPPTPSTDPQPSHGKGPKNKAPHGKGSGANGSAPATPQPSKPDKTPAAKGPPPGKSGHGD